MPTIYLTLEPDQNDVSRKLIKVLAVSKSHKGYFNVT